MTFNPKDHEFLRNIQGDILEGFPKKGETFFFFQIKRDLVKDFCSHLLQLTPLITSAATVQKDRERIAKEKADAVKNGTNPVILDISGVNIAFSHKGLLALGIRDDIKDDPFKQGMAFGAEPILRDDIDRWKDGFREDIHGVILVAGSSHPTIEKTLSKVLKVFQVGQPGTSIEPIYQVSGHARPGDTSHHEHFGFADGISQPTIKDFSPDSTEPADEIIPLGTILAGREGDTTTAGEEIKRPKWALDGSFLCFRQLKQRVPEFNKFLADQAVVLGIDKELLGARLVGRWKSGAPIDRSPDQDDAELAADPVLNNNFRYDDLLPLKCPFAAHTRKTYPRSDLNAFGGSKFRRIMRRGIQYGPEVTKEEENEAKSSPSQKLERGLLFACYQSNLKNGFEFIQRSWANEPRFPPRKPNQPGFDPIIGVSGPEDREMTGLKPHFEAQAVNLTRDVWVVPRGGEYFFSPSISALQNTFAQAA